MNLEHVEHIEISRSYSKKVQEQPYAPAEYFASYRAICKPGTSLEELDSISENLSERCEDEVMAKIDPHATLSRRATIAALKTQLTQQARKIEQLEAQITIKEPF